jgi:fermentation-respiration switch protein FrsA (DUF1100 family)
MSPGGRGPQTATDADSILAVVRSARDVPHGVRHDLDLVTRHERIPAVLLLPSGAASVPGVLLLHGLGSEKERMGDTVGMALLARGVAALALDLPMHGERDGAGLRRDAITSNPVQMISTWRAAIDEARLALEYLASHPRIDAGRLGIVGYSLGSFLANIVASELATIRAVVLAASGDLPDGLPFASIVRTILDPLRAVRRFAGRPLLMVNGRYDRTVTPAQAERLFAAAHEPKTMRWHGGGHWPPPRAIDDAAAWLAGHLHPVGDREHVRVHA